jgi:hypothetical protein
MDTDEPSNRDRRLEQLRGDLDKAHAALMDAIREDLAQGATPSRIARHAGWTREYIGKIRDGKAGGPLRRRSR